MICDLDVVDAIGIDWFRDYLIGEMSLIEWVDRENLDSLVTKELMDLAIRMGFSFEVVIEECNEEELRAIALYLEIEDPTSTDGQVDDFRINLMATIQQAADPRAAPYFRYEYEFEESDLVDEADQLAISERDEEVESQELPYEQNVRRPTNSQSQPRTKKKKRKSKQSRKRGTPPSKRVTYENRTSFESMRAAYGEQVSTNRKKRRGVPTPKVERTGIGRVDCPRCGGTGGATGACPKCGGSGMIPG